MTPIKLCADKILHAQRARHEPLQSVCLMQGQQVQVFCLAAQGWPLCRPNRAHGLQATWDLLQQACHSFFQQEIILASTAPAGWMMGVDQVLRNQVLPPSWLTNGRSDVYHNFSSRDRYITLATGTEMLHAWLLCDADEDYALHRS